MTTTSPPLTEALTEDEYDTLVRLTAKADALIKDRLFDYLRATGGYGPKRAGDIKQIQYKARDRAGRDSRYDIEVSYPDPYGDGDNSAYAPSSLLWDPEGAIGKAIAEIEAERAAVARLAALQEAEYKAAAGKRERAEAARLAKKYGYVKR